MRGDFGVGLLAVGEPQLFERFIQITHAVLHPAQAVDDRRLAGFQGQRLLDQLERFGLVLGAIGERIAQRIHRIRVVRLEFEHAAQIAHCGIDMLPARAIDDCAYSALSS